MENFQQLPPDEIMDDGMTPISPALSCNDFFGSDPVQSLDGAVTRKKSTKDDIEEQLIDSMFEQEFVQNPDSAYHKPIPKKRASKNSKWATPAISTDHMVFCHDDSLCPPPPSPHPSQSETESPRKTGLSKISIQIQKEELAKTPRLLPQRVEQIKSTQPSSPEITPTPSNTKLQPSKKERKGLRHSDSAEYLPESPVPFSPLTRTPLFSVEDYAAFTSRLSRDQMRALPFSVRRKLKALLVTGTASEADAAAVSEHLDPLLYVSGVQPLRSLLPEEAEQLTNQATEATALFDEDNGGPLSPAQSNSSLSSFPSATPFLPSSPIAIQEADSTGPIQFMARPRRNLSSPVNNNGDFILSPSSYSLQRQVSQPQISTSFGGTLIRKQGRANTVSTFNASRPGSEGGIGVSSAAAAALSRTSSFRHRSSNNNSLADLFGSGQSPAMQFLSRFGSATNSPQVSRRGSIAGGLGSGATGSGAALADRELGMEIGEYIIGKQIAHGGFSQVREARTIDEDGHEVVRAVKIMDTRATILDDRVVSAVEQELASRAEGTEQPEAAIVTEAVAERSAQLQAQVDHEVVLWKALDHKNLLRLRSVTERDGRVYCFADKISGGTLYDLVRAEHGVGLSPRRVVGFARQLSAALLYLHETMRIVHRDVKLENCLIEDGTHLLLCDFGMSDYFADEDGDYIDDGEARGDKKLAVSQSETEKNIQTSARGPKPRSGKVVGPAETSSIMDHYHKRSSGKSRPQSVSSGGSSRSSSRRGSTGGLRGSISAGPSSTSSADDGEEHFGSFPYASPEVLESSVPVYAPSVDMWAFGVVVYALVMGDLPWSHALLPVLRERIIQGVWDERGIFRRMYRRTLEEERKTTTDEIARECAHDRAYKTVHLLRGCFEKDPRQRLTIRQVIDGRYLD